MTDWKQHVTMEMLGDSHQWLAKVIGIDAMLKLCDAWGGTSRYIPTVETMFLDRYRDEARRAHDHPASDTHIPFEWLSVAHRTLAEQIGMEPMMKLCKMHSGEYMYIPSNHFIKASTRAFCVKRDASKGMGTGELSRKYEMTQRNVERILNG